MIFRVEIMPGAKSDLDDLDNSTAGKIVRKFEAILSVNPHPHGDIVRRYTDVVPPLSRLKFSGWRIMFEIHGGVVKVIAVAKKERAERTIRKLRG